MAITFDPTVGSRSNFFFFIKCKNCIDQKVAKQACRTSWKPAVHMDRYIQAKEKHNKRVGTVSHQALEKNNLSKQTFIYNRREQKQL
jgi:hypothetical protein